MKPEYKRYPSDGTYNERAIGISLPFNRESRGRKYNSHYASGSIVNSSLFEQTYTTEDQAIYNLINLLLTRKGERVMQPLFGSRIPDWVFEQNTPTNRFELENDIRADISFWLPYIWLGEIQVLPGSSRAPGDPLHSVTLVIPFKVTESGANIVITFRLSQLGYDVDIER